MFKQRRVLFAIGLVVLLLAGIVLTVAAEPLAGTINWSVFGSGGKLASNGNIQINSTVGQALIGPSSSGNITLKSGYWGFTPTAVLTVTRSGSGSGAVSSNPAGISCGTDCSEIYIIGAVVTLTATADAGSIFTGWSGPCSGSGTGACVVTITQAYSVDAQFTLNSYLLAVSKSGTGSGTVSSTPTGIDCGADCSENYFYNTVVTLTATTDTGSTFTEWSGACSGMGMCVVTMNEAKSVDAEFTINTYLLTVSKSGSGSGTVSSIPVGIDCGENCSESYAYNTIITLTVTPDVSSNFTGWSGACSGTGSCQVTMNQARSVNAAFTVKTFALTVAKDGTGTGLVSSNPGGIDCGTDCSETLNYGTVITLTAIASPGSTFTGWSGACSGTGNCVVTMIQTRSVDAGFTLNSYLLTVSKSGSGSGTVSSNPAGISCGGDCSESYFYGTVVTLTATASTGSTFTGWSGACSGTGACVVTMDEAKSVNAAFTINTYLLTVSKSGTGSGTVSSFPVGIDCGADCSQNYTYGTVVTLTVTADANSTFTGWSGTCSGTGQCVVTIDEAHSVTANFVSYRLFLPTILKISAVRGAPVTEVPQGQNSSPANQFLATIQPWQQRNDEVLLI